MRRLPFAALALSFIGCAGPALGDAVTYRGTLGALPIILEIATSPDGDGRPFARFAYMAGGTDIPLNGIPLSSMPGASGTLRLEEEARCTSETCLADDDGAFTKVPIRADWTMTGEGASLSGTRTERATGRTLPVRLERRGARPIEAAGERSPRALMPEYRGGEQGDPPVLDPKALPYDFLKMDWPRTAGPETTVGAVVLRMETDERTGIAYPVVSTLGGQDTAPINAYLLQRRLQASLDAFACRAQAYAGFSWDSLPRRSEADEDVAEDGTETGADGPEVPTVTIEHVSPRLIGLSEANSVYCGGAHPDNYLDHHLADAKTGAAIAPETLLAGWTADGPSEDLVAIVSASVGASVRSARPDEKSGCDDGDLIADSDHFGVYLTQDDLVFTLRDLPHAIFACTEDLLTVPLTQARPLLTKAAARYIPALDR